MNKKCGHFLFLISLFFTLSLFGYLTTPIAANALEINGRPVGQASDEELLAQLRKSERELVDLIENPPHPSLGLGYFEPVSWDPGTLQGEQITYDILEIREELHKRNPEAGFSSPSQRPMVLGALRAIKDAANRKGAGRSEILGGQIVLLKALNAAPKEKLNALAQRRQQDLKDEAKKAQENKDKVNCEDWNFFLNFYQCGILSVIAQFLSAIAWLFAWITFIANLVFNFAIHISVDQFSQIIEGGIRDIWSLVRNIVNVLFIFVLLYVAVSVILQIGSGEAKKTLVRVILVALLVNFSFFFTSIIIDFSNVLASGFYTAAAPPGDAGTLGLGLPIRDISTQLNKAMGLGDLSSEPPEPASGYNVPYRTLGGIFVAFLGQIIMYLVTAFVLLAGAILFFIRSIVLIFLLVLAPLAFLAWILPKTRTYAEQWWNQLINQALFAPLYLFLIYVTIQAVRAAGPVIRGQAPAGQTAVGGFNLGLSATLQTIVMFILVNGLMLSSLILAKKLGAAGASLAMVGAGVVTGGLAGYAGKTTKWGLGKIGAGLGKLDEKIAGGRVSRFSNRFSNRLKTIGDFAQKKIPGAKGVGQFFRKPLTSISEGVAKITKGTPYDLGTGFLGPTKEALSEKRKKAKEEQEMEAEEKRKKEIEEQEMEAKKNLRLERTEINRLNPEHPEAAKKIRAVSNVNLPKMEVAALERNARHLTDTQMNVLEKELAPDKFKKIKVAREKPLNDALKGEETIIEIIRKERAGEITAMDSTNQQNEIHRNFGKLTDVMRQISSETLAKFIKDLDNSRRLGLEILAKNLEAEDLKELAKVGVQKDKLKTILDIVEKEGKPSAKRYIIGSPGRNVP